MPDATASSLPSPADQPQADVVIYDGRCGFCRSQVHRLQARDGRGRLAFLSLHDPQVAERYPDLSAEELAEQMYVVDRHGRAHGGAHALRYLSRRLPGLWWLAPVLHVPGSLPLWQWLYRKIAQRRFRLSGQPCDDDACETHLG